MEQQRAVTREFLNAENIKDKRIGAEIAPVQLAVYKLQKSGSQIASGDLSGAKATLAEAWVGEFSKAASSLSSADAVKPVASGLSGLQSAVASGDAKASKKQYVAVVTALEAWASASGLSSSLSGL